MLKIRLPENSWWSALITCRQAHLKEKTQFFRLLLEGRVVAEEGVAIELVTIRHGLYGISTF